MKKIKRLIALWLVMATVFVTSIAFLDASALDAVGSIETTVITDEICVVFKETPDVDFSNTKQVSEYFGINAKAAETVYSCVNNALTKNGTVVTNPYETACVATITLNNATKTNMDNALSALKSRSDVLVVLENFSFSVAESAINPDAVLDPESVSTVDWNRTHIGLGIANGKSFSYADDVRIAVLSTGANRSEDLEENIEWNLARDVYLNSSNVEDTNGLGTSTLLLLAADYDDGVGINGLIESGYVIPVKITQGVGWLSDAATVAAGVLYAIQCGADIINFGFDLPLHYVDGNSAGVVSLIDAFDDFTGLFVTNAGADDDGNGVLIGNSQYDDGKVNTRTNWVVVGMSGENDVVPSDSHYSRTYVDLFAPAYEIVVSDEVNGERSFGVNSTYAAVHMTAACALLMQKATHKTHLQIKQLLLNNVDEVAAMSGKCVTGGRLDVGNAADALFSEVRHAYSLGDINGDGVVDTFDYTLCKRIYMGTFTSPTQQQLNAADIDRDGEITTYDFNYINRYYFETFYFAP